MHLPTDCMKGRQGRQMPKAIMDKTEICCLDSIELEQDEAQNVGMMEIRFQSIIHFEMQI